MGAFCAVLEQLLQRSASLAETTGSALNACSAGDLEYWNRRTGDEVGEVACAAEFLSTAARPPINPGVVPELWWLQFRAAVRGLVSECQSLREWTVATTPSMLWVMDPAGADTSPEARGARMVAYGRERQAASEEYDRRRKRVQDAAEKLAGLASRINEDNSVPSARMQDLRDDVAQSGLATPTPQGAPEATSEPSPTTTPPATAEQPVPDAVETVRTEGFLSPSEIAERHGVGQDALRKRLDRWRGSHWGAEGRDWVENANRGPRDPQYIYRVEAIHHIIDEMKSPAPRPAKKNPRSKTTKKL